MQVTERAFEKTQNNSEDRKEKKISCLFFPFNFQNSSLLIPAFKWVNLLSLYHLPKEKKKKGT